MKIIDLLNKIANGEEVPKWIVYDEREYSYNEEYKDYIHEVYNNGTMLFLSHKIGESIKSYGIEVLNDDLSFIEEDKKIAEIEYEIENDFGEFAIEGSTDNNEQKLLIIDKINEIIDKLNKE